MKKLVFRISLFLIILAAILLPRIFSLDSFVTTDENLWAVRSANFYFDLGQRDFDYKTSHPGVTTLWAGTAGFLWRFPEYRGIGIGHVNASKYKKTLEEYGFERVDLLAAGRVFMVLANTAALGIGFFYAIHLLGVLPSVIGFLLIAFDPFHIAHTRLLHLDGLSSSLILLSLLAFITFLDQYHHRDLIVSGIAAGVCWLTKSPGVILAPIVFLLVIYEICFTSRIDKKVVNLQKLNRMQNVRRIFLPLVLWGVIGVATFTFLWPSMWVDPIRTLSRVFNEAYQQASRGWGGPIFFNKEIVPDGKLSAIFYPLSYLWRSTPIVLIGLIFTIAAVATKQKILGQGKTRRVLGGLVIFVTIYFIFINLGQKKADRYLLPVYAPLDLIAALGWFAAADWLVNFKFINLRKSAPFILITATVVQMILAVQTYPYYLSYYNPILGGGDKAPNIMMIGWGEGLDQAARYLNEKHDANKMRVISWYGDGCFSYFFQGKTIPFYTTKDMSDAKINEILDLDYAVIYIQQRQREIPKRLIDVLDQEIPEYSVWINDIEYVRIYNLRNIRSFE
jgi:hypothetical protein